MKTVVEDGSLYNLVKCELMHQDIVDIDVEPTFAQVTQTYLDNEGNFITCVFKVNKKNIKDGKALVPKADYSIIDDHDFIIDK